MSNNLFETGSERFFTIRKICDFDDLEIKQNLIPHLHDYYSVFWIESGEAIHSTVFVDYSLRVDTILFVPPGLKHLLYIDETVCGT